MKLLQTIAASVLVLGMGSAFAEEPMALTDAQMDKVNAGEAWASADAKGFALFGKVDTYTTAVAFDSKKFDFAAASASASSRGIVAFASSSSSAYAD
jgi:hypothetical protein